MSVHDLKSRHHGEEYLKSRPLYPASFFDSIRSFLAPSIQMKPTEVLDLGAGTGYAAESFLKVLATARMTLLEPDASMLEQARVLHPAATLIHAKAETIALADQSVDLALIGSAWHWMDYALTLKELERVLAVGGLVYVFEYQFPKVKDHLALNEWVRRQFNLNWKAPTQVPRGSLYEITEAFRRSPLMSQVRQVSLAEIRPHTLDEFAQMIYSQSRFLHYEESLPVEERFNYRLKIKKELQGFWLDAETLPFLYAYEGYAFRKRP